MTDKNLLLTTIKLDKTKVHTTFSIKRVARVVDPFVIPAGPRTLVIQWLGEINNLWPALTLSQQLAGVVVVHTLAGKFVLARWSASTYEISLRSKTKHGSCHHLLLGYLSPMMRSFYDMAHAGLFITVFTRFTITRSPRSAKSDGEGATYCE
jgi:hypothetical protein